MAVGLLGNKSNDSNRFILVTPKPENGVRLQATLGNQNPIVLPMGAVSVKAKVTVRANIDRLIGGAGEQTIIARVGEGIVTTVGSAAKYKSVLENPDSISKVVLEKGLDSGTAYEILSIDIADVDVARNIGARLQTDQAEADKRIAEAKASERGAMAVARTKEMEAEVQAMRAKVVAAEAKVPEAIANALESGRLGVLDYYQLKNMQADTEMRKSIAGDSGAKK